MGHVAGEAGLRVGTNGLTTEKALLPRIIHFVPASADTSEGAKADGSSESAGPTPAYYLYPQDKVRELFQQTPPRAVGRGLRNAGNTCFFNSVLQVLTHIAPLQNYLIWKEHSKSCEALSKRHFCAVCLLERHVVEALERKNSAVHPQAMLRHLRELGGRLMRLGRQHDAHEFLRQFLDACHRSLLSPVTSAAQAAGRTVPAEVQHTTLIHQLFGGYLRSQIQCLKCKQTTNTFDPFMDACLEVHNCSTLEKALEGFFASETLSGPNQYKCRRCEGLVNATKKFTIFQKPPVLTLQLKRFAYGPQFQTGKKILKPISFSPSINLKRFSSEPSEDATYRLIAVIVHSGFSARSGHYIAYIRNGSNWYCCDDERVRTSSEPEVLRSQAYLLVYQAVAPDIPARNDKSDAAAKAAPEEPWEKAAKAAASPVCSPKVTTGPAMVVKEASSPSTMTLINGHSQHALAATAADNRKEQAPATPSSDSSVTANCAQAKPPRAHQGGASENCDDAAATQSEHENHVRSLARLSLKRRRLGWRRSQLHLMGRVAKRQRVNDPPETQQGDSASGTTATESPRSSPSPPAVQTAEERVKRATCYSTQFGQAQVDRWEEDALPGDIDEEAFEEVQRRLQPAPEQRDELDKDIDKGRRKHKAKRKKEAFEGKSLFDAELRRRKATNAGGRRYRAAGK